MCRFQSLKISPKPLKSPKRNKMLEGFMVALLHTKINKNLYKMLNKLFYKCLNVEDSRGTLL